MAGTAGEMVLVIAERQYTLASTFLRFQEYYENPKFRGEFFSLEEFMDWYAMRFGDFTYYRDWGGFNIPSSVLAPFRGNEFDPLSYKEQKLLKLLADIPEPFYVVGIYGEKIDLPTLKHELVHGLFYTAHDYHDSVLKAVGYGIDSLTRAVRTAGYHESVVIDETNAYLMMGIEALMDYGFVWDEQSRKLRELLQQIFKDCFGFSLRRANVTRIMKFFRVIYI